MSQVAEAFTMEELDLEHGELVPARETMAHVNIAKIMAINAAAAVNVHSPGAVAAAAAIQKITVVQF